ncbi:MAG TPA: hypothetical protein VFF32_15635 [Dermatophilaceae bacterium]|nr:hypothetical protein [Dermatophilaceae bacterium]
MDKVRRVLAEAVFSIGCLVYALAPLIAGAVAYAAWWWLTYRIDAPPVVAVVAALVSWWTVALGIHRLFLGGWD